MAKYRYKWLECEKEHFKKQKEVWIQKLAYDLKTASSDTTYNEKFGRRAK